ncbi:MAG: cysteine--tRNA ligase [Candidatus Tectomicrobia bacterium]|uniref:Cysteine--tRNA ligase n=1 Tax=Tectimicrobiota bacterium TaxID=2528274 RepID=A0A933LQF7_UNCTE|nr:cysteine--tRNA ligase [Candidatus Tectomicrobia bacterium]
MPIRILNTLTGTKEEFVSIKPNEVNMYVCGVTVYDLCHLGHARGAIIFDVIQKYFTYKGYKVNYVRNFTDIDDKIIKKAKEEGQDWKEIASRYIAEYYRDMDSLGVARATLEPKATEHITHMLKIIGILVKRGYAYQVPDGDVYFAVEKFPEYGKLSKRDLSELLAGARVEVDEQKLNPLDFVLWKRSKPGEPMWASPWGEGRPGWHIECSAMSMEYLGESFDIHGGGKDLIFPHHENEIAQSEAFSSGPYARYWIHNGFVNINQEKMSKSLGNVFTIRDLTKSFAPEAIRFFLLSTHYRSPIDFSYESINHSQRGLDRFYTMLLRLHDFLAQRRPDDASFPRKQERDLLTQDIHSFAEKRTEPKIRDDFISLLETQLGEFPVLFREAMDDDFNSALAISRLFDLLKVVNTVLDKSYELAKNAELRAVLAESLKTFLRFGQILGLFQMSPKAWFQTGKEQFEADLTPSAIEQTIEKRNEARREKNWALADEIRNDLAKKGIVLEDSPKGTSWKYKH